MTKKRHLRDLYVRGVVHTFDDGEGEPITVYLKKLNTNENEEAIRKANAVRARVVSAARDDATEAHQAIALEVEESEREDLVEYLIQEEVAKKRESIQAEVAGSDKWNDEDYLQGLHDSWAEGGMNDRHAEDPEDPEAKAVFEKLKEFTEEVDGFVEKETVGLRRDWKDVHIDTVREKSLQHLIKTRGDLAWVEEYRKCEVYIATRDPENHRERYFEDRSELDEIETEVLLQLLRTYRDIDVEPPEGKDSEETPSS